ncbi:MAG TPA: hypothetical protein VGS57_02750 [Thermoanaerobaculia bacterium]|nr:hypothetical protein [Thermoanaerobaculia bacterium]
MLLAAPLLAPTAASAWQTARIEARVDNLDELLGACARKREEALDSNREVDAWVAYKAGLGEDVSKQAAKRPVPACDSATISARLATAPPAVWAMTVGGNGLLYATVNLPSPAILVSGDGGHSWHYRHLFLGGYNVERAVMLRGIAYRDGLLAVASDAGVLLSADDGLTFTHALPGKSLWAVAISPLSNARLVAGGDGTSFLSEDGGTTWSDLAFSRFTRLLATNNPHRVDHITSAAFDPDNDRNVYFGTGSHLYRFVLDTPAAATGRWQAMEGNAGGHVLDDSTVYNIEIGERFMISTCNGVYYLDRLGADTSRDQADVSWGKFRDATFTKRGVGGPKGNLRAYYVAEDPVDRDRVLVADFAALYEGTANGKGMHWKRVEDLPYGSQLAGYPEYTSIAWTRDGQTVVGSRYRGIFVDDEPRAADPGPSCVLR